MKNDLKSKIKDAYASETPDLKERIVAACENERQYSVPVPVKKRRRAAVFFRRLAVVASCLILFGVGLYVGKIIPESQPVAVAETCIYLDVNPSLELSLDEDNVVLSCTAVNEDAETVLNGMNLEGVELKTALNAIVGSMYVNGYLSSADNSMLVSVDTNSTDNTNGFLSYITNQVNKVLVGSGIECAIIAQGVEVDEELKLRAKEQGVSVGKMHLLDKMVDGNTDLTQDNIGQLSHMHIKDLVLLYAQRSHEGQSPENELVSGSVNVEVTTDDALNAVLEKIDKTIEDIEEYHIHILPSRCGEKKAVYAVTLKLYGDETVYKYDVDLSKDEEGVKVEKLPLGGEYEPPKGEQPNDTGFSPNEWNERELEGNG